LQGLADACGMSKSNMHSLEKGTEPRINTAYKIANILGQTVYSIWPDNYEVIEETITVRTLKHKKE